ncbi:dehydrogenase [Sporocytophaga myxococcoides]|uniref:Dehydrogenase n=1 Tax=Sporocytophaga myxococcoides TaxID=153721 RepID=A0A098LF13_9BACT|nr:MaoC family dehydratase [Sporocytophaga myxococcoides]GAL85029.1 dehydrogenase [Sporocytophaga myxococcoides]
MLDSGQVYSEVFSFTQEQVIRFAEVSGDHNPVHLDADYASKTAFKKPIVHGILGTSIFSKILGMNFPGEGTIYLKQEVNFKRPMYASTSYEAVLTVLEINRDKHQAVIETKVLDKETGKVIIDGQAQVMNKEKI